MPLWRSNQSIFKPRAVALLACALLTFTGCRSFQVAQQRSVEDLYFEALKAKPEATLAMDHPLYGQTPTSQLELAEPRPTQSQSPAGAPQEPPSPEARPPLAPPRRRGGGGAGGGGAGPPPPSPPHPARFGSASAVSFPSPQHQHCHPSPEQPGNSRCHPGGNDPGSAGQ